MFNLFGILEQGTTAVGTVEKDGQTYLVAVSLVENLSKAKTQAFANEIKSKLIEPDKLLPSSDAFSLADTFADVTSPFLSISIDSADQAVRTVEPVLEGQYRRLLFLCNDRKSYLTTCAELAMSKRDFFRFGQLKNLLVHKDGQSPLVLGSAHKLADKLNKGDVETPFWNSVSRSGLQNMARDIVDAEKFLALDDKWDPANDDFVFYPGDYRLPFSKCLFEYRFEGEDPRTGKRMNHLNYVLAYDYGGVYNSFIYQYRSDIRAYSQLGFGPSWQVDERGHIQRQDVCSLSSDVWDFWKSELGEDKAFRQAYCALRRIAPTLTAFNNPNSRVTLHQPPPKLARARERGSRIPFFKYHEVEIDNLFDDEGNIIRGNAIAGRQGTALHMVRGHVKPSLDRWISPYPRGDARFGVINKGFRFEG